MTPFCHIKKNICLQIDAKKKSSMEHLYEKLYTLPKMSFLLFCLYVTVALQVCLGSLFLFFMNSFSTINFQTQQAFYISPILSISISFLPHTVQNNLYLYISTLCKFLFSNFSISVFHICDLKVGKEIEKKRSTCKI